MFLPRTHIGLQVFVDADYTACKGHVHAHGEKVRTIKALEPLVFYDVLHTLYSGQVFAQL